MIDLGVHMADLARWLLGEVRAVIGKIAVLGPPSDVEDNGAMILHFQSGAIGVSEASWTTQPRQWVVEVYGSKGTAIIGHAGAEVAIQRSDGVTAPGYSVDEIVRKFQDNDEAVTPMDALLATFFEAIRGRADPVPSGIDGMKAVELIEACYRSARSGTEVALPLRDLKRHGES
jgi:predicted dehydrogenase